MCIYIYIYIYIYLCIYIYIYPLVALYDLFSSKLVKRNRFAFCLNTVKLDRQDFSVNLENAYWSQFQLLVCCFSRKTFF